MVDLFKELHYFRPPSAKTPWNASECTTTNGMLCFKLTNTKYLRCTPTESIKYQLLWRPQIVLRTIQNPDDSHAAKRLGGWLLDRWVQRGVEWGAAPKTLLSTNRRAQCHATCLHKQPIIIANLKSLYGMGWNFIIWNELRNYLMKKSIKFWVHSVMTDSTF